ncbi:MAG: hypothetical protein DRI48_00475 [Chloroflexi bacterium]|nr:MAG: hypothetical protein DRI48_00475 [Chloroflexota bacterium]
MSKKHRDPLYRAGDVVRIVDRLVILLDDTPDYWTRVSAVSLPDGRDEEISAEFITDRVPSSDLSERQVRSIVKAVVPQNLSRPLTAAGVDVGDMLFDLRWLLKNLQARLIALDMRRYAHKVDAKQAKKRLRALIRDTEDFIRALTKGR